MAGATSTFRFCLPVWYSFAHKTFRLLEAWGKYILMSCVLCWNGNIILFCEPKSSIVASSCFVHPTSLKRLYEEHRSRGYFCWFRYFLFFRASFIRWVMFLWIKHLERLYEERRSRAYFCWFRYFRFLEHLCQVGDFFVHKTSWEVVWSKQTQQHWTYLLTPPRLYTKTKTGVKCLLSNISNILNISNSAIFGKYFQYLLNIC